MTRCDKCPGENPMVPSCGPLDSSCVFIGEAPGKDESKRGEPFVGKTGDEVNRHYLPCAGLQRADVFITNSIRCLPTSSGGKLDPKKAGDLAMLKSCTEHNLFPEIEQMEPRLLVPMGSFACRAIDPDINLELQHGFPLDTPRGKVFPMYHPAGGIHEPKKMLLIRNDWIRLGKQLKGRLVLPRDHYANPDYRVATPDMVCDDLDGMEDCPMANDTETMRGGAPYCLTYSVRPGTGRLIRADDTATLEVFQYYLDQWRGPLLWHNYWLFDIKVVRQLGLRYPRKRIIDTMLKVFHLGNLPQGLKALSYRELGMEMKDFDDVVRPHAVKLVLDYYQRCQEEKWEKPEVQWIKDDTGSLKKYAPQSFNTKLKRFFTDYGKNPDKDPFSMWNDNWGEMHEVVETKMGKWPGLCISYAPFDEVMFYACRDADSLLRLYPRLTKMVSRMRKTVQENWGN